MIVFDLDIQALTEEGIQIMDTESFSNVRILKSRSMIDELMMIEMLMLLKTTFGSRVIVTEVIVHKQLEVNILMNSFCLFITY